MDFSPWLQSVLPRLRNGEKIDCPFYERDLAIFGFVPTMIAEPFHGQSKDLEHRLKGSRLHAQVMSDERIVIHLDRHDPKSGIGDAIRHFVYESKTAVVLGAAGFVASAGLLLQRLTRKPHRK